MTEPGFPPIPFDLNAFMDAFLRAPNDADMALHLIEAADKSLGLPRLLVVKLSHPEIEPVQLGMTAPQARCLADSIMECATEIPSVLPDVGNLVMLLRAGADKLEAMP